jgi:hypothetical protein
MYSGRIKSCSSLVVRGSLVENPFVSSSKNGGVLYYINILNSKKIGRLDICHGLISVSLPVMIH